MRIFCVLIIIFFTGCSEKNSAQTKKHLPMKYFESENFENLKEEYLTKSIEIDKQKININLNFDQAKPSDEELITLNSFLNKLSTTIKVNTIKIRNEFEKPKNNTVNEYITHHLAEISKGELYQLIDSNDKTKSDKEKLFDKIKLTRIGIYPQDHERFAIFDYTIGENYTQYLIVITTDKNGKIIDVTTES